MKGPSKRAMLRYPSIKLFMVTMLLLLLLSEAMVFYFFYKDSKEQIENLLKENIKANVLNLKHYLEKNLQTNSVGEITSFLDNKVYMNSLIADIHILSKGGKLLYSTDRDSYATHPENICLPIYNIKETSLDTQECFTFSTKQFRGLDPYYLSTVVYLNSEYIKHMTQQQFRHFLFYMLGSLLLFAILAWLIVRFVIIKPLEKLRQFAYYSTQPPDEFYISELESIRYSLDLTFKRLQKEQKDLYNLSTRDPLSGLYNRLSLIEKVEWLISEPNECNSRFALLFLDLDNFKTINDIHGHEYGDKVLMKISELIIDATGKNNIVSRFGGDEFVVVLPNIQSDEEIIQSIQSIQKALSKPIPIEKFKYHVTCSMGVTIYPKDGNNVSTLLKHADIAMYKSKELGKNNFHFYTEELNDAIQEKMHMQRLLLKALEEGYFVLHYQPKVDIKTGKITGCEALIRLNDPTLGMIPPQKFISVAEESGIIIPMGKWIIDEAVRQLKTWQNTPLKDMKLSINISGVQLNDKEFLPYLTQAVKDIDPSLLDIELTESVLIEDFEEKIKIIDQIKALGISLSLDDFGTGYSSISYLKNIPFDTLKIDRIFIQDLDHDKGRSFVKMIIDIANDLQLTVIAEGVETEAQLSYLRQINCDLYQGYYCSKAIPAKALELLFVKQCKK